MIYGTKMIYKYSEEIPKVNANGETLADDNGDFITENIEKKIELSFNLMTYLIYKNVIGTDLMKDFITFGKKFQNKIEKDEKVVTANNNLTDEEIEKISEVWDDDIMQFLIQVVVAMIATSEYPKKRPFEEIIKELPLNLFLDGDFIKEVVQLISFNIKKKNK